MAAAIDITNVDLEGTLTLTVAWRSGRKMKLGRVETGPDVDIAFREIVEATISDLHTRSAEDWAPDADLTAETYLVIDADQLGDAPILTTEFLGTPLAEVLKQAQTIPTLNPGNLPVADLAFYALTIDRQEGSRVTLLRRSNPRRGLRKASFFAGLGDSLSRIEEPIFAFDGLIDLVFVEDQVAILSSTAFAAIFRDQETLTAQVPKWVDELSLHVPIAESGRLRLAERALAVTHLRTRLEAIVTRGHLKDVPQEALRKAMMANDLDPDRLLTAGGELVLEEGDIQSVLYFLNEDLFYGSITEVGFRADKKATR